jgi:hypothetical protein
VFASVCAQIEAALVELVEVPFHQFDDETARARLRHIGPR